MHYIKTVTKKPTLAQTITYLESLAYAENLKGFSYDTSDKNVTKFEIVLEDLVVIDMELSDNIFTMQDRSYKDNAKLTRFYEVFCGKIEELFE